MTSGNAVVNAFFLVYAALFPIVNPIADAPLFLGLTQFCTEAQRITLARRVALNSFFLLVGSMFIGSHVLEFFGISLPVVRIGGGLVVSAFGWKLLNAEPSPDAAKGAVEASATTPDPFYPLTMPLTVGPGSMSVAISLGSQRPKEAGFEQLALVVSGALAGVLAIALTVYFSYRFAQRLVRFLGPHGTQVVVRLSAFILLCIGIQILWSGWSDLAGAH
ncbi:MAG TPA: MarC family protein [Rhizomicrobium sp.]|nr:MarC family protein [Rhizomicrobium sp.]